MSNAANAAARKLAVREKFKLSSFFRRWEMILVYILIVINIALMITRSNLYFSQGTIQSIIQSGMDLSPMVLGMILILLLGDIDVSVASTMILSSMTTGLMMDAGMPMLLCVVGGILTGCLCGAFNGFLVAYVKMPAVIVTISTAMLFRGIVKIVLGEGVLKNFPAFYNRLAWYNVLGIPVALLCFLAMAAVFVLVLHRSSFGRRLYMIGNNPTCSTYSGINVRWTKLTVFVIMGFMCGIASIFFVGRMGGGMSSTMGTGYELNTIAICVLGGVSPSGGKGKVYGPVIATLIMAFLIYTLGLMGVDANPRKILIGLILIVAVLIPYLNRGLLDEIKLKALYKGNRDIAAIDTKAKAEMTVLKSKIVEAKNDDTLDETAKNAKVNKYEKNIETVKAKSREQILAMKRK